MKNLLVFCFFPSFVPPKSGGEVRLYNSYFELCKYFNITMITSGHLGASPETIWHTNNFVEKRIPKDNVFAEQWQSLQQHAGNGDLSGPCIAASGGFLTEMHKAYLSAYSDADAIIHEFPFTITYDLFCGLDNKARIYNSHNCEYVLYQKLHANAGSEVIPELVRKVEQRTLDNADLVTFCGENDLQAFRQIASCPNFDSQYIPNGMTVVSSSPRLPANQLRRAVFIGSGHLPNVEAAQFIVQELAAKTPGIHYDIIGSCLPSGSYADNVTAHGLVSAARKSELIATADIAVNPMLSGSGSSMKILDFVAHQVPLLSTPIGMRGFDFKDGEQCLLAEAETFAATLHELQHQAENLHKLAISAKEFAYQYYSWQAIANSFQQTLNNALGKSEKQPRKRYVLALNDYDPFDSVGGGATRLRGLYEAIAEWSDVVFLCFSANGELDVTDVSPRIKRVRVPKSAEHCEEEAYFNARFHISANDIVSYRHAARDGTMAQVYEQLRLNARIVQCEHPYMVALPDRFGDRFVYSSHNAEYALKKEMLLWHPDRDLLLADTQAAEEFCLTAAALVVTVSETDAQIFVKGRNACAPIMVIPNGVQSPELPIFSDQQQARQRVGRRSAVFLGSAHMPNVDAARFISDELAPACPEIEFHIIGGVCDALPSDLLPNVVHWGVITDSQKSAILGECTVALNPMFSGSGSNVKLADFFANGMHVVSTDFGVRGYPAVIHDHVTLAEKENFVAQIRKAIDTPELNTPEKRTQRKNIFLENFSMQSLGAKMVTLLKGLEIPKKRMLFVTYRYTAPILGGAEAMLAKLVHAAGDSGRFSVDIICPEVTTIKDHNRFSSRYEFDPEIGASFGVQNVRYLRFPLDAPEHQCDRLLARAWRAHTEYEKQCFKLGHPVLAQDGLAWGWGYPERSDSSIGRWAYSECGLHLSADATVRLVGYTPRESVLRTTNADGMEFMHAQLDTYFDITFQAGSGYVQMYLSSHDNSSSNDTRPLGMYISLLQLNGVDLDLSMPALRPAHNRSPLDEYLQNEYAARSSRARHGIELTTLRGPHSSPMEEFIREFAGDYDLVVTHNSVFRPAVAAIAAAKTHNVPSILIPHAHLDDDYYHFPDLHQCALDASLVLAAPRTACEFYTRIGAKNVDYLPAGIESALPYSPEDEAQFRTVFNRSEPFFLVLGRKASAKGYRKVIHAAETLASRHACHLVLIGPDDDGMPVHSAHATYLGPQPAAVVRGALRACLGLVNMSSSESFGMVLLEAWLANRPVIANTQCAAFHDLAIDEHNALLVTDETLATAMERFLTQPSFADALGAAGRTKVDEYAWPTVCANFLSSCEKLVEKNFLI